jgi:hypothetical protein
VLQLNVLNFQVLDFGLEARQVLFFLLPRETGGLSVSDHTNVSFHGLDVGGVMGGTSAA